jgi:hypothetical protein
VPASDRRKARSAGHRRLTARPTRNPTPSSRLFRRVAPRRTALSRSRRSLAVLECTFLAMTRNAERLQIRKIVSATVDQRNLVVEFPERAPRHEPLLPHPSPHATPLESAAQLVGVHAAPRANTAVAPANALPQHAGIRRVVGRHTDRVPTAAAIDQATFLAGLVPDRLAAPSAGPTRSIRKRNLGASVIQSRFAPSMRVRSARLRAIAFTFGFGADSRVFARLRDER